MTLPQCAVLTCANTADPRWIARDVNGRAVTHYHRRSNVESTMWMIKSKFGGSVRSRLPTAQANEVLAKVLCHNLTCIVHAIAELGTEADFGLGRPAPAAPTPEQPS